MRTMADERRAPISVGDALRAVARLRPGDAETLEAIDGMLGLHRAAMPSPVIGGAVSGGATSSAQNPQEKESSARDPGKQDALASQRTTAPGARTSSTYTGKVPIEPPSWASLVSPLDLAAGGDASLPPPPLFAPGHARAILSAALSTLVDGTDVDVDRVTATLSRGQRLGAIPYKPVPSLRRGAQLLVDRGPALDPLREDRLQLIADLERLFGRGHLEAFAFAGVPSAREERRRSVRAEGSGIRAPWRAPGPGVPVLVLSDFCLAASTDEGHPAELFEWIEFARDVRDAGCSLVGLVPYPPARWPSALSRCMAFIHFSERTTARDVMRGLRDARPARGGRP
jgi:hypothetical protein